MLIPLFASANDAGGGGGGSTLVYGPDTFTVGADTELNAYNTNWNKVANTSSGSAVLSVRDSTNDIRQPDAFAAAAYRWTGSVLVSQRIVSTIVIGPDGGSPVLNVMVDPNGSSYDAEWSSGDGNIRLQRSIWNGSSFDRVELARSGTVATSTTYPNAYLKAIVSGSSVVLTYGDDVNGLIATATDTDADRLTTGAPGLGIYNNVSLAVAHDDVSIYSEDETITGTIKTFIGTAIASVKTIHGIAIASVKTILGLDV